MSWRRHVLLPAFSVLVGLATAEFLIRLTPFGRPKLDLTPFFQYDRTLGWKNRPFAKGTVYDWEYVTRLQYNSHGMRGPDLAHAKPPGTYRVIVLGDSFIDAFMVPYGRRVTELLEKSLNQGGSLQRVEVVPMGVVGYSTDQELLWLESEGFLYSPDLVVLMFFDNDIYGNGLPYFYGPKPQFLWDGRKLALHNVPVPEGLAGHHPHEQARWNLAARFPKFHRWAVQHSRLYRLLIVDLQDLTPLPPYSPIYKKPETPEVRAAWGVTGALLARMQREVAGHGARFMVFYIPRREDVYRQEWAALETKLGLHSEDWNMRGVTDHFLSICRDESLDCIEPTEQFVEAARAAAQSGRRLYNKYDAHWNENGHRLAAEILVKKIQPELQSQTSRAKP